MIICENNTVFAKSDFWSKTRQPAPVSPTCHERTLPVRSQSVPSWQVVPRGRDIHFDTHIYRHRSIAHIVYALLMHTQNRSEDNENREIASTVYYYTVQMQW